jgi:hypothetical protein
MTGSGVLDTPMGRRGFLRGAGRGAIGLTAGGLLLAAGTRTARAANTSSLQGNWGWCSKCSEIYWATGAFKGSGDCPAQPYNGHVAPGWNYSEVYNQGTTGGLPGTPGYQSGWYFCSQCSALVWHGTNPAAACPGNGGQHSHNLSHSYNYAVPVGITGPAYQGGWNFCNACGCLYHSNAGPGTQAGYCWVVWNSTEGIRQQHVPGGSWPYMQIH